MDKKRLVPAVVVVFSNLLGATIIIPILPLFAVDRLGGTIFQAVLLDTAYYAAKLMAAPVLGRLSDAYGRRPLLLISQAGTACSFLLFLVALPAGALLDKAGLSPGISGGLALFYAARILDGITGGNTSVAQAYVSDISPEQERARALGVLSAALGVGFIVGPALGGLAAARFGPLAPFVLGAGIAAVSVLITFLLLPESLPSAKRVPFRLRAGAGRSGRPVFANRSAATVLVIGFLVTLCFSAISPTFSLYAKVVLFGDAVDPGLIGRFVGLTFMIMGIVIALTQVMLIKPLVARLGRTNLLTLALLLLCLTFLTVPSANQPTLVVVVLLPLAVAYSVSEPTLQALVTSAGGDQMRGQLLGLYQSALSLAFIVGPLWAGIVFVQLNPRAIWTVAAVLLVPAVVLSRISIRSPGQSLAQLEVSPELSS